MIWTETHDEFLRQFYPVKGKAWCAARLGVGEASIRAKASKLGLRLDHGGEHWRDFQQRAAESKIGKKRPAQSEAMRRRAANGELALLSQPARIRANAAAAGRWNRHPHPRGMLGKNHSVQTRARMSVSHVGKPARLTPEGAERIASASSRSMVARLAGAPTSVYSKARRGWREVGGRRMFFRSRWEANYARYLDWLRARGDLEGWDYEPETFWFEHIRRGCRSYTPDFRVQADGQICYHEVKGWMDPKSKTKLARMARHHPLVSILVVDEARYRAIERALGRVIPGWERGKIQAGSTPARLPRNGTGECGATPQMARDGGAGTAAAPPSKR